MSSTTDLRKQGRLPLARLLAYCSLTFPIVAVGMPVSTFLPPLYAGSGGLGLATVGAIFMIARIWDVISDPIIGFLVDRFQWKHNRRKVWIALSIPFLCITAIFLYMPERGVPANAALLLFQLIMIYTGWTLLQTAHQAWGADLAPSYDERSRLFGSREIVNVFGSIFILALPAIVGIWMPVDEYMEVAVMGLFLIIVLPLAIVLAFAVVPDKAVSREAVKRQRLSFGDLLGGLKDRTLWRVLLLEVSVGIGVGVTGATFLFVARGVVGLTSEATTVLLVFFVASILGIPIWLWLSRKLEKHISLQIACVYSALMNLVLIPVLLFAPPAFFIAMVALVGIGFGAPQALLRSMMADQIDREEIRSGANRAGFYFAFMSTAYKLGQASAIGVSFMLLALIGFNPEAPGDPTHHGGLILVFTVVPALTFTICVLLCRNYPITRAEHEKHRAILESRADSKPATSAP